MIKYNNILNLFYLSHKYKFWWEIDLYDLKKIYNLIFKSLPDKVYPNKEPVTYDIDNYSFITFDTDNPFLDNSIRSFNIELKSHLRKYKCNYTLDEISMLFVISYITETVIKTPNNINKKYKNLFSKNILHDELICEPKLVYYYVKANKDELSLYKRKEQIKKIKEILDIEKLLSVSNIENIG